jgi:hypothetical protein
MSLKKLDDPASKDFWDFVEKSTRDWRQQQPDWSRELERQRHSDNEGQGERRTGETHPNRRVG